MHVEQFTYGALTPALAYAMSYLGCLLGLMCATRARLYAGVGRILWVVAGALSLGGTGIWVMHFIAMLGFSVPGMQIRYDLPLTALSAAIAIVAVFAGVLCAGDEPGHRLRLLTGGILTGCGVAGMHYLGMAAMVMPAQMGYEPWLVAASVVVGILAATVALWFTLNIRSRLTSASAAAVMAVAVCGMHYTGMAAVRMHAAPAGYAPTGGTPVADFLLPLGLVVGSMTVALCLLVPFAVSPSDVRADAELEERIDSARRARAAGRPVPAPTPASPMTGPPPATTRAATAAAFARRTPDDQGTEPR